MTSAEIICTLVCRRIPPALFLDAGSARALP